MNFRNTVNFGETTLKKAEDQKVKKAEAQKAQAQGRMMTGPVVFESATLCVHSELQVLCQLQRSSKLRPTNQIMQ